MKSKTKICNFKHPDSFLEACVRDLVDRYHCHTVLLYGSRARGDATPKSDYDLMGVCKTGQKLRVAKKSHGKYLDAFIFPERELKKPGEEHLYMKEALVLVDQDNFGKNFLSKLRTLSKKPPKPLRDDELRALKVWAFKMLERIAVGDIEANYRRSWLHEALLSDYFSLRKMRYTGSKESFAWLRINDLTTYKVFDQVLKDPTDLKLLKRLVKRVVQ